MKIIFLGTGTSHGIPMIGCNCKVCSSQDIRDKRTRTSLYIEEAGYSILIDTAPELRLQCIENKITKVDVVLFTHSHADHIVGLDDLRRFSIEKKLPCFSYKEAIRKIQSIFSYAFRPDNSQSYSERPNLKANIIEDKITIGPFDITALKLFHGREEILGYRINNIAYCTDCSYIPEESILKMKGLELLILDALRYTPHPTHFNVQEAIKVAKKIMAKRTYFTHIAHEIKHSELENKLPEGINLAYDGLTITI